jgi:ubiquinol-cytochrome c reductase cytochrome b subunit
MTAPADVPSPDRTRRIWTALDLRLGLSSLAYPVPRHANRIGYILGGISVIGFIVLAITGILLAQWYRPDPSGARQSIAYITGTVPVGDVLRGIHFWMANLVMATVLLHLGRVFVTGSFKRPREANWLIGVGLLVVTLGMIFTGTVLKWDQEGYEALQHNVEAGALLGSVGAWFSESFALTLPLVGRLYMAHVVILPGIGLLLLIAHFLLVKHLGISSLPEEADAATAGTGPEPVRGGSSFAAHLIRMLGFGLVLVAVAAVLSIAWGVTVGDRPNPAIEVTKPWWMFLPFYPFEDWFGLSALLWVPGLLVLGLMLVPLLDRSPWRSPRRRKGAMAVFGVVVAALVGLVLYALASPAASHVQEATG